MSNTISCLCCGNSFSPVNKKHIYCCNTCRDRMKQRKYRLQRQLEGKCPQCNKIMDYPTSKHKTKNKITYCSNCRKYFHNLHINKNIN